MMNPAVVSTRSRMGSPTVFPAHIRRIDVVEQPNGEVLNVQAMNPEQKFRCKDSSVITIVTEQQRLVFRHSLNVRGMHVNAKLTMLVSPDRTAPRTFLNSFYRDGMNQITTGLLVAALRPYVQEAIAENLSFVDVARVPKGSPVRNASRHAKLAAICKRKGLYLFYDELVLEAVYASAC